jgi:hypothetical protein
MATEPPRGKVYHLQSRATQFFLIGGQPDPTLVALGFDELARSVAGFAGDTEPPAMRNWVLEESDLGVRLKNEFTGFMLDSNLARRVYLMPSNDGSFQKWRLVDGDDEGFWSLVNVATSFALDGGTDGVIHTMGRNDGAFQRWKFIRAHPLEDMHFQPPGGMAESPEPLVSNPPVHPGSLHPVHHDEPVGNPPVHPGSLHPVPHEE